MPEYYVNGNSVVDTNVINNQTIADLCNDTVREMNNLTEELQHTDLSEVVRPNHDHHSSFNDRCMENALHSSKSVHDDGISSVQCFDGSQSNAHNTFGDHDYAIPIHNHPKLFEQMSTETEIGNLNCDVVDSSPLYTQFNTHLENNMDDNKCNQMLMTNNLHEMHECANGRVSSEGLTDDEYQAMCMLQSIDLRGENKLVNLTKNPIFSMEIIRLLFFSSFRCHTTIIVSIKSATMARTYRNKY